MARIHEVIGKSKRVQRDRPRLHIYLTMTSRQYRNVVYYSFANFCVKNVTTAVSKFQEETTYSFFLWVNMFNICSLTQEKGYTGYKNWYKG